MGRFWRAAVAVLVVWALSPGMAAAQGTATEPTSCGVYEGVVCQGWFTDEAGVVDDDQAVEDAIDRLVGRYGNQIALVVVSDSRGREPEEFAVELANAWGVGSPETQDGVLILVSLAERRTELVQQARIDLPGERITGAGNSFFGAGEFEQGMFAIIGSLEQELEAWFSGETPPPDDAPATPPTIEPEPGDDGPSGGVVATALGVAALVGGGIGLTAANRRRRQRILARRTELVDGDLEALEPAGHELLLLDRYAVAFEGAPPDIATGRALAALRALDDRVVPDDPDALRALWATGLLQVVDADRLARDAAPPLELRASGERQILEEAVQQAARDCLEVDTGDDELFEVRRQELQRVIASLRPHRVAAARKRAADAIIARLVPTAIGSVAMTTSAERFLRAGPVFDPSEPLPATIDEMDQAYATAKAKTEKLEQFYAKLPGGTTRPAVAAALADLGDDADDAYERYERLRVQLETEGAALAADGLAIPAVAALLLMNNDEGNAREFIDAYDRIRNQGFEPDEAVEYALAGLREPGEIDLIRREARRFELPVSITAALLRRRDDGPKVYRALLDELADHGVTGDTRKTVAGVLAISLEPAQAMRRWLEAREALGALGLEGAYADVAAAFGASDPRGPRAFALAYAAQRQALARSSIEDADRFAPELAHEGTRDQTDTWTGRRIPPTLGSFDPFTLLFYHWVITKGHHGSYGWEPVYRDRSWSGDRQSWWGGTGGFGGWGGGGGFSGGGGSSWGGGSWGGSGGFGGFGGGGGFSGGGGSGW